MSDFEQTLSVLLVERAERVGVRPGHRESTLGRARRRRVTNAVVAGVATAAVVAAAFGVVRSFEPAAPVRPAAPAAPGTTTATAGDYGFWSKTGPEYPWIARGYFRDTKWELRAAAIRLGQPLTRVTLRIHGRAFYGGTGASVGFERLDGGIYAFHHHLAHVFDHEVAAVFGAVVPETRTVDVVMDGNDTPIEAHVYEGYDARTGHVVDYWVAFVPADVDGRVVARDSEGGVVATAGFTGER